MGVSLFTFISHAENMNNDFTHQKNKPDAILKQESSFMIDFSEQKKPHRWRISNDDVMGGESEGRFLFEQGKVIFDGYISLNNNGGFSSIFTKIEPLPENIETVTIDIEGDGLIYQLRVIVNVNGYRLAYKHNFTTVAGKRETLTFQLANFQASFRGRILSKALLLKPKDISQVGFLVTRKVAGSFSLSVFSVIF